MMGIEDDAALGEADEAWHQRGRDEVGAQAVDNDDEMRRRERRRRLFKARIGHSERRRNCDRKPRQATDETKEGFMCVAAYNPRMPGSCASRFSTSRAVPGSAS